MFKDFVPYHLHTHSIELAMRGFLHAEGTSTEQLERIGHKLMNLLERCVEQGIGLGQHEARPRDVIALLNADAKVQTFRYYEGGRVGGQTDRGRHPESDYCRYGRCAD